MGRDQAERNVFAAGVKSGQEAFLEGLKGTAGIRDDNGEGVIVSARNMALNSAVKIDAISGRDTNVSKSFPLRSWKIGGLSKVFLL